MRHMVIAELKQNLFTALNCGLTTGLIEAVHGIFSEWNDPHNAALEIISQIVEWDEVQALLSIVQT